MDKNQIIGFVLMAALLIGYMMFFESPEELVVDPVNTEVTTPDNTQATPAQNNTTTEPATIAAGTGQENNNEQYGVFGPAMTGTETEVIVENDQATFVFSTKGGLLKEVQLKEFTTWQKEPLILFNEKSSQQSLTLQTTLGNVNIADLFFTVNRSGAKISGTDSTTVTFTVPLNGNSIVHTYKIGGTGYEVKHNMKVNGLQNIITGSEMSFAWFNEMRRQEKNLEDERNKSTVMYYTLTEETEELSETSQSAESEQIAEGIKWLSFNQKFFNAGIIAEKSFNGGMISTEIPLTDTTAVKGATMNLAIPMGDIYAGADFKYYLGPNDFQDLKRVAPSYEENVYMGYSAVSWVNKYIIVNLFSWLETFIGSYGVIIIILVFIIKLCLFPLSRKSYLSMAKMKALKPELDIMKERLGDDKQKIQQEQMQLYRQVGVNPISGCLPVVLQMPFLFAMFFFFPNAIALRGESFLWAQDLSTYDVLFYIPFEIPFYGNHVSGFTLLMTISTILYTWSNNQVSSVQGPMKTIGYVMPLIFMFVLNSYASGLCFYYFVSNIFTFGQQTIIRRFVDEDKIRATLEENKKKNENKGQSKWQQKLGQAMKASQEVQKQKQQQKKKK